LVLLLLRSQSAVLRFEIEDHADAGQIETGFEQVADPPQPVQVVGAVAAGPAVGPLRFQQPARLVQAQVLGRHADQFRGD
jgi:hypothetical protein